MFDETLQDPIKIAKIIDPGAYYKALHGAQLKLEIFDGGLNLMARGIGCSWNEQPQVTPVLEWNHRQCVEIVTGAMPPGQLQIQTMFFMHQNDAMPTLRSLTNTAFNELTALVRIAEHEDPRLKGVVLEAFEGCVVGGQSGNWNSQSLYLKQAQVWFRVRLNGIQWVEKNPDLKSATDIHAAYPAE